MPYTLANLYVDANENTTYRSVTQAAICYVANEVLAEDGQIAQHTSRLAWANKTLSDPETMARKMIWGVLSQSGINSILPSVPDGTLLAAVRLLVNSYLNA